MQFTKQSKICCRKKRLPCPESLTISKRATGYGKSVGVDGVCDGTFISGNLSYGTLPVSALGLEDDMAEHGYETKFSYVVDVRFTRTNTETTDTANTTGFELTKFALSQADGGSFILNGMIDPQGPAGIYLLPNKNGIFILISHGANKFGGYR